MKKWALLLCLAISTYAPGREYDSDYDSEFSDDEYTEVFFDRDEYQHVWKEVAMGHYIQAVNELKNINEESYEDVLHSYLIRMYIAIRTKDKEEFLNMKRTIDRDVNEIFEEYGD